MERNGEQKKADLKTKLPTQKTVFPHPSSEAS
jgi:hypothetical protein